MVATAFAAGMTPVVARKQSFFGTRVPQRVAVPLRRAAAAPAVAGEAAQRAADMRGASLPCLWC